MQDSNSVIRRIFASHGELIASPSYLAAHGMPTDPEELREHECAAQSNADGGATWHLQDMNGVQKVVRVSGRFSSNAQEVLRKAACTRLGIGLGEAWRDRSVRIRSFGQKTGILTGETSPAYFLASVVAVRIPA